MTPEEIRRFDLRRTCYHEAAHCVVAEHFGARAYVTIEPTRTEDLGSTCSWTGQCHCNDSMLDDDEVQLVGLAGAVADWLVEEPDPDYVDAYGLARFNARVLRDRSGGSRHRP